MGGMTDLFLLLGALGVAIGLLVVAYCLFDRYQAKRPYLQARWDDAAGDWVNEEPHDVGPDPLLLLASLEEHLKAYAAAVADLYEPASPGDHTTTNPTGDQT